MNRKIAVIRLMALALVLAAGPVAYGQGPAEKFPGMGTLCEIDLPLFSASGDATSIWTTDWSLHCPNNAPPEHFRITCTGTVPLATLAELGITKGTKHFKDIPCKIKGNKCGVPGRHDATTSSLKIKSNGQADLDCKFKP